MMTPSQRLSEIAQVFETVYRNDDGTLISTHALYNLESVIEDIERAGGRCDTVDISTLKRVYEQLVQIYRLLPQQ